MSIERSIIQKLRESRRLSESGFDGDDGHYSSGFGHYCRDGESITREEYFKAKERSLMKNTNTPSKSNSTKSDSSWSDWRNDGHGEPVPYKQISNSDNSVVGTVYDLGDEGYGADIWDNDEADEIEVEGITGKFFKSEEAARSAVEKAMTNFNKKTPTPEDVDSELDDFDDEVDELIDELRKTDYRYRGKLEDRLSAIRKRLEDMEIEEYVSDEQFERSQDILSKLPRDFDDIDYEEPEPDWDMMTGGHDERNSYTDDYYDY